MLVKGDDDGGGMVAEINVTPLVDVMLVLLVVFIVTAPLFVPQSLGVKLPQTASVQSPVDRNLMTLAIGPEGALKFEDRTLSDAEFRALLEARKADPKFQLQIEADENLRYGRLAQVMALAQAVGVSRLSFVTVAKP